MKNAAKPITKIEKLYLAGLLIIFGLIVLHAPLSVFFGTHLGYGLIIKAWKELLMGGLLVLAGIIVTRHRAWRRYLRDPFIIASLALAVLYTISMQYGHGLKPYGAGLLIDLRYILYAVLVYVGIRTFPEARTLFVKVGLAGAIVVVGYGVLQFFLPKDFLAVLGYSKSTIAPYTTIDSYEGLVRLQSTLRGPNPLGAYTLIVALITGLMAIRSTVSRRWRIWLGIMSGAATLVLFASYSRSAYAGLLVGALVAAVAILGRQLISRRAIVVGVLILVLLGSGVAAISHTTFYASVLQHTVAGSGSPIKSDQGHSTSLSNGLHGVIGHPLGFGTGSTGSASLLSNSGYIVENQFLYVAHEAGWLALLLFCFIFGRLLQEAYVRRSDPLALGVCASGIGLLVVGMVLPVFADDTVSMVWFGLAALIAGGAHESRATH